MKYYLFLDESGDHGLRYVDGNFPIFLLCGILISEEQYKAIRVEINSIKTEFWNNNNVIFHSRDIRKCQNEFQILFDLEIKKRFYDRINNLTSNSDYKIIAASINKEAFIKKYGKLEDDVYEISLSFVLERTVFCLDGIKDCESLEVVIERRGRKEDRKLAEHIVKLTQIGTHYVKPERIKEYGFKFEFKWKHENINGLQLTDLVAYPIARYVIEPKRVNLPFDTFSDKFYTKNGKRYGLKEFP